MSCYVLIVAHLFNKINSFYQIINKKHRGNNPRCFEGRLILVLVFVLVRLILVLVKVVDEKSVDVIGITDLADK